MVETNRSTLTVYHAGQQWLQNVNGIGHSCAMVFVNWVMATTVTCSITLALDLDVLLCMLA